MTRAAPKAALAASGKVDKNGGMNSVTPVPLAERGRIGIIAPSSRGEPDAAGILCLEARGYSVAVHAQNALTHHQSAGTPEARAGAVMDAFADPATGAVMAARGGNRAMHILPHIDFDVIARNPKPLISFSDGTALLNAIHARTGLVTYHGPTLSRVAKGGAHEIDQMIACLEGRGGILGWPDATVTRGGRARGRLLGGNLSVFTSLCGTPYMPDTTGAILFFEDIGDQLSRYDRMLAQLKLAGVLQQASAIIFGVMLAEGDSSVTPFGFSLAEIVAEHTADLNVPVVMDAPFGHKGPLCTLPVGGMAALDTAAKTLTLE